jgi:HME family heavy-metal exporter
MGTYQELKQQHGLSQEIILQGSLERLAPVLMSSLTTGLGLLPLMIGGTQPGKEMLYPVATVIVGGLVTSTLCEFLIRPGLYWFSQRK